MYAIDQMAWLVSRALVMQYIQSWGGSGLVHETNGLGTNTALSFAQTVPSASSIRAWSSLEENLVLAPSLQSSKLALECNSFD